MGFKSLSRVLQRRQASHTTSQATLESVARSLARFAERELGVSAQQLGLDYVLRADVLTIKTPNKAVANELSMRMGTILVYLREDNINPYPARIVVQ